MSWLKKIIFLAIVILISMNITNADILLATFFIILAIAVAHHILVYRAHARFTVNYKLTEDYKILLTSAGIDSTDTYAVIEKRIGNPVKTYNTRYKFGLTKTNLFSNYYFKTKYFAEAKYRMDNLKSRLSKFTDFYDLFWKKHGNEFIVLYVKARPSKMKGAKPAKISRLEFDEIISAVGG